MAKGRAAGLRAEGRGTAEGLRPTGAGQPSRCKVIPDSGPVQRLEPRAHAGSRIARSAGISPAGALGCRPALPAASAAGRRRPRSPAPSSHPGSSSSNQRQEGAAPDRRRRRRAARARGDQVKAGDILVRLDETVTRANLAIVTKGLDELTARKARLEAERDGAGRGRVSRASLAGARRDPAVASSSWPASAAVRAAAHGPDRPEGAARERIAPAAARRSTASSAQVGAKEHEIELDPAAS